MASDDVIPVSTICQDGEVVVWKVDARGRISSLCQYRLKGAIYHCMFRPARSDADAIRYPPREGCNGLIIEHTD
jgi:hypothetical protein